MTQLVCTSPDVHEAHTEVKPPTQHMLVYTTNKWATCCTEETAKQHAEAALTHHTNHDM